MDSTFPIENLQPLVVAFSNKIRRCCLLEAVRIKHDAPEWAQGVSAHRAAISAHEDQAVLYVHKDANKKPAWTGVALFRKPDRFVI